MAHVQVPGHEHLLHLGRQLQQSQQVGGRAARAAHGLGGLFMGEAELLHQALQAAGFFQRVEVFPLHVFDQGHDGGLLVVHLAHEHRHLVQAGQLRSPEAALAGNDLVAAFANGAHQERLHHTLAADAFSQFVQRALVHDPAGLVLAGPQLADGQGAGPLGSCGVVFGAAGGTQ